MNCPSLTELPLPPHGKVGWPWTVESRQLPDTLPDGAPWPKISIVTPSLNQGQFIEETIRSVLLQGYPNLEYIIIDGGSTDNSVQIIKKYEKWLSYWVSEADKGQAQAINKGFRKATGEILSWLNSDDFFEREIIDRVTVHFHNNKYTDVVFGKANKVDLHSNLIGLFEPHEFNLIEALYSNFIPQPSCFWRKSVITDLGYLDETYIYAMDYEFWIRCGIKKHFSYMPFTLSNFRIHSLSKSELNSFHSMQECIKFLSIFFNRTDLSNLVLEHKKKALRHWNERLAINYFRSKLLRKSRQYFLNAIFLTPFRLQNITLILYVLDTYFGSKLGSTTQSLNIIIRKYLKTD